MPVLYTSIRNGVVIEEPKPQEIYGENNSADTGEGEGRTQPSLQSAHDNECSGGRRRMW